jgi:hypothetical protein
VLLVHRALSAVTGERTLTMTAAEAGVESIVDMDRMPLVDSPS